MAPSVAVRPAQDETLKPANNTHPSWWRDAGMRKLNLHLLILLLGSYTCGFDGSVMNGFFGIESFLTDVGNPDPSEQGLLSAAISLGYLIGFIPSSYLGDKFGRRMPQLVGSVIVIIGTFVQVFALSKWNYFGARIIIGFGAAFPLTLGSTHLFELAHPRQAVQMVTFFAAFYWVGAIVAAWSTFGCSYIEGNWAWRVPALLQGLASLIQALALYWVPESPRWLAAQGRKEEAHAILAKYHANGDLQDELVICEMAEIATALELEQEASAFGYLDFLKTPANRMRLFLVIWVGLIVQWVGNGIISYYLVPILASVGVSSVPAQQGLNGGLQIWNLAISLVAVVYCQSVSRRFMWLFSTVGCLVTYSMFTACSAVFNSSGSSAAGNGAVAMIFVYSGFYDVAYSVFYYTYVLEILPFHMRTKGMAISLVFDYGALFFNQYVNPIGFNNLGYQYYYVYIGTITISFFVILFTFPETAGLTLEQSATLLDGTTVQAKVQDAAKTRVGDLAKAESIEA